MASPKPKPAESPRTYSLILGLRRIKTGSFKGLWELTELSGECSVKRVITDANVKASVINLAARAIGETL